MQTTLETNGMGNWAVRRLGADGKVVLDVPHALAVGELCRKLGRSRRHVYRYIKDGWLAPVGKFLGEWLVDARGVEYLRYGRARRPKAVPTRARGLFPEYHVAHLHPLRDAVLIIHRIMERGGPSEAAWLFRQYPREALRHWLSHEGWRLDRRSANFWSLVLGVQVSGVRPGVGDQARQ